MIESDDEDHVEMEDCAGKDAGEKKKEKMSLIKGIAGEETTQVEKKWQSIGVWRIALDRQMRSNEYDIKMEITNHLKRDLQAKGEEIKIEGDPALYSAGRQKFCIHAGTKTPQGRMMCPWTQRCCPILWMSLGENGTTVAEREALKYAHIQTAIHVDENARET